MVDIKKIKEDSEQIRQEVRERINGYILAAFGFVAGLAWNEAVKAVIEQYFPIKDNTVLAKLVYALLVTAFLGLISVYLLRASGKKEESGK